MDGKFFRLEEHKFHVKGVSYGPFAPDPQGLLFPSPDQIRRDFLQLRDLGANLVRVYCTPPLNFLDLAAEHEIRVLVDLSWPGTAGFLDALSAPRKTRAAIRQAVRDCRQHPAIFAFNLANEIPADIVRWSGVQTVQAFIDSLVGEAKAADPEGLCTYAGFPPTEYLCPQAVDFVSFNVYLHERPAFESYLDRLQMIADAKPLLLTEFGIDALREGADRQADIVGWQIEAAFRAGLAGTIVFSFTDDWWRGGMPITDWAFGLTTRDRQPRPAFEAVRNHYRQTPPFALPEHPRVSVVVASYNGGRTLQACLDSLFRLHYPDYEVILVDDGSTDDTPEIARSYPRLRVIRHPENRGLSAARNTGIAAATGAIVAFTDADCRADEDWVHYLVGDLHGTSYVGMGGHNVLPPDDSLVASAVMVSPGGPAHVMLTDRDAEHIPGCNMAFHKWALTEVGGFDPIFRTAGDDVDLCWRLQERGYKIGFSPGGFVWHYRRSTVRAYMQQQRGYGEAEALLARKHPKYFNAIGRSVWRGRIYAPSRPGIVVEPPIIYRGPFASSLFQKLYTSAPAYGAMLCTSLEFHVLVTLPLLILTVALPALWPLALASAASSLAVVAAAAAQANLPPARQRFWSRPLVAALYLLQPVARGWGRYRPRLRPGSALHPADRRAAASPHPWRQPAVTLGCFWSDGRADRYTLLHAVLARLEREQWQTRTDTAWADHDLEIFGPRWSRVLLTTVSEPLDRGRFRIRFRLVPRWSLPARCVFWALVGVELLAIGLLAPLQPWIWMLLLTVPLLHWILEHEQGILQHAVLSLIEDVARDLNLARPPAPPLPA
ncbi:MAG: glycosyltransferase [Verrucomicrobia bacterium]|nr:glycosyltransferase [Verrucomicrobiota bacterium]